MKGNTLKSVLLLVVISVGITTAWLLRNKPVGKYDKAAIAMLDKLYHPQYRLNTLDKIEIDFESSSKTRGGLYALKNIEFRNPLLKNALQMGQFKVTRLDQTNKFPHFFTLEISALKITRDTLPGGMLYLPFLQLRLKEVLADATIVLDYKPATKLFTVSINIQFRQLFNTEYQLKLSNFNPELLTMIYAASKRDFATLEHHIDNARLVFSKFKLTNKGFIQKVFNTMSPAMTKTINQSLSKTLARAPNRMIKQGAQALIDFMRVKKSLTVTIAPTNPIGIKEYAFANNQKKRQLLNTSINAEK